MFKQMTAYEMRISDLSSDVWSSDLGAYGQGSVCGRAVCALDVHEPALDASRGSFGRAAYGLAGVGPPVAQTRRSQGQASLSGAFIYDISCADRISPGASAALFR